ncbi:MAG: ice-binding family protein [Trueperaceae bacterium]
MGNTSRYLSWSFVVILSLLLAACGSTGGPSGDTTDTTPPTVASTFPVADSTGVATNSRVTASFAEAMDASTVTSGTFTLAGPGTTSVAGTVALNADGTTAVFTPSSALATGTLYTATLSTGAEDEVGNALATAFVWAFTTDAAAALGPQPVFLGTAGDYVILAKTAISTTGTTQVVGDVGISPAARSYITGFSESMDASNEFATSAIVTGKIYAADMAPPTPTRMTTAISDMETAYIDAAGRVTPDFTGLGAGDISGLTLDPGLYKWSTGVAVNSNVTLDGGADDVWILQIAQDLTVADGVEVFLTGGALPENVFWQVAGQVTLGTTATIKGVVLSKTSIVMNTGAVFTGRALAQTAVTLDANAVTAP